MRRAYKPLTIAEQKALARKPTPGNLDKLARSALPLAFNCALRFYLQCGKRVSFEDILEIANVALAEYVKRYNPEKGAFSSYIRKAIRMQILKRIDPEFAFLNHKKLLQEEDDRSVPFKGEGKVLACQVWRRLFSSGDFSPLEKRIVRLRLVKEYSFQAIADAVPAKFETKERARQVFSGALRKLRNLLHGEF